MICLLALKQRVKNFFCKGLFGEGPAERRERLRKLLVELGESAIKRKKEEKQKELKKKEEVTVNSRNIVLLFYN